MRDEAHDLQFAILDAGLKHEPGAKHKLGGRVVCDGHGGIENMTDLEAFILKDLLDSNFVFLLGYVEEAGGKYDAKGAIANDLAVCVRDLLLFAGLAVGSDDLDYPRGVIYRKSSRGSNRSKERGRGNEGVG